MSEDIKQTALDAAGNATDEDTAKDALAHVTAALEVHPDDADLVQAAADLTVLAGLEPAASGSSGAPPPETPPDDAPPADSTSTPTPGPEPEAAPEAGPVEPVAIDVPPHAPETGGWPNDWPVWAPKTRVRARQIVEHPFTIAGLTGEQGDYVILHIDENGDVVGIDVETAAEFEPLYDVVP